MIRIAISDLHLGSDHTCYESLRQFLRALPRDCELVLNGDTLDNPAEECSPPAQDLLEELGRVADRIVSFVWVEGNHDGACVPARLDQVPRKKAYQLGNKVYVEHGHLLDNVMPQHRWFLRLFRTFHRARVLLGASPVHVAEYAKRWRWLYSILRRSVKYNAVELARSHNHCAVVCGHVHYAETDTVNDIIYYNTGCWTEAANCCYLLVDRDTVELIKYTPGESVPPRWYHS